MIMGLMGNGWLGGGLLLCFRGLGRGGGIVHRGLW